MDEVEFHREPPTDVLTMVTAFSGWIDAGEAATAALRFLVRQLAAEPLATIDLEDFVDFTQDRPVVRLNAAAAIPAHSLVTSSSHVNHMIW